VSGSVKGLLYGDWGQFGTQAIDCFTLPAWVFGGSWVFFKMLDQIIGMRVSLEMAVEGFGLGRDRCAGLPQLLAHRHLRCAAGWVGFIYYRAPKCGPR
jgi:ammonium transporter, Amt family